MIIETNESTYEGKVVMDLPSVVILRTAEDYKFISKSMITAPEKYTEHVK